MPVRSACSTKARPGTSSAARAPSAAARTEAAAPVRTTPMSVGPAPDQLAASAPASTSAEKLRRLWEERRTRRLVDAIVRRFGHECVGVGEAGHQEAHTSEVEHHVRQGQRLGEHAPGLGGGQVAFGDEHDKGQLVAQRKSRVHGQATDRAADDKAAEHAGRRVLGMPVVGGGHRERIRGTGRRGRRRGERGGRAEPPGDGDLGTHRDGEVVMPQNVGRHTRRQVGCVVEEAGSLALAVHAEGGCVLDVDAHVAVESHGQGVETRPEVGRRRRGPGAHEARLGGQNNR